MCMPSPTRCCWRARSPMPGDPVRTLDALHVATMTALRDGVGPLAVLSLDERVRAGAMALGFVVLPEAASPAHSR